MNKGEKFQKLFDDIDWMRESIIQRLEDGRERSLALTKLEECELWIYKCEPKD